MSPCGNIVLIGLSGAGKTSCALLLAELLNLTMLDTDKIIQSNTQKSIAQIFADGGEAQFRLLERAVIEDLLASEKPVTNTVLSVGGGLPTYLDNIELLKRFGFTVFLNTSPRTLAQRLVEDTAADKGLRPLLGANGETRIENQEDKDKEKNGCKDQETETAARQHIENLEKKLDDLLAGRLEHYSKADAIVNTDDKSKQDVCFEIQTILINNTIPKSTI